MSDESIKYSVGSLGETINEIDYQKTIDYLITFGFTHGSREEKWIPLYHNIARKLYAYRKDGTFFGGRCVEVWEKQ